MDFSKCFASSCNEKETTHALRINFSFTQKGHRPRTHVAYLELYVCSNHALHEAAQTFKNEDIKLLGEAIAQAIHNRLDWEHTTIVWAPKEEAIKFFERVNKQEAALREQRKSSIVDAANDPENIQ